MANMMLVAEDVKKAWAELNSTDEKYVEVKVFRHAETMVELQLNVGKFHYWIGGVNDRISYAYCEVLERKNKQAIARYTLFNTRRDGYPFYYGDLDSTVLVNNIVDILSKGLTRDICDFLMHRTPDGQLGYIVLDGEEVE